jgi:hypothetical protein
MFTLLTLSPRGRVCARKSVTRKGAKGRKSLAGKERKFLDFPKTPLSGATQMRAQMRHSVGG